jgi:methionyl-tRNA synthetase
LPAITACAGNQVLMVSGSDTHGTPITVTAEQEKISPEQVIERYHASFYRILPETWHFFRSLYAHQYENHWAVTTDIFVRLREQALYLY